MCECVCVCVFMKITQGPFIPRASKSYIYIYIQKLQIGDWPKKNQTKVPKKTEDRCQARPDLQFKGTPVHERQCDDTKFKLEAVKPKSQCQGTQRAETTGEQEAGVIRPTTTTEESKLLRLRQTKTSLMFQKSRGNWAQTEPNVRRESGNSHHLRMW